MPLGSLITWNFTLRQESCIGACMIVKGKMLRLNEESYLFWARSAHNLEGILCTFGEY